MSLCLLVTLSAVESNETVERNETFYITNGTALTNVMCGKVAESAVAMEWFIYKDRQWAKMMKCYNDSSKYSYYSNYTNNTYECVHTSLVIKNIKLSALLKCNCVGNSITHSSTIMVIVVGKLPLIYFFTPFNLVVIEMCNLFKVYREFLLVRRVENHPIFCYSLMNFIVKKLIFTIQ